MKKSYTFDRISYTIILVTFSILPFFVIPYLGIPATVSKLFILFIGITLAFLSWLLARLFEGTLRFPRSSLMLGFLVLLGISCVSGLLSPSIRVSFIGNGFSIDTVLSLTLLTVALFLVSALVTKERLIRWYSLLISASLFIFLYQLGAMFLPNVFAKGILEGSFGSLFGSGTELSIMSGAIAILCTVVFEQVTLNRLLKCIVGVTFVLAIFFLIVTNIHIVWGIVGMTAFMFFVYMAISKREQNSSSSTQTKKLPDSKETRFPLVAFLLVTITALFFFGNSLIGGTLSRLLNVNYVDVRPSLSTTVSVAQKELTQHPIFGAGPNRFSESWVKYHPLDTFKTSYWNSNFTNGVSKFATITVTLGLLGFCGLLYILYAYIFTIVKSFRILSHEKKISFHFLSVLLLSIYFLLTVILFVPSVVSYALFFFCLGLLIHFSRQKGDEIEITFLKDPRLSVFSIIGISLFILLSVASLFLIIGRFSGVLFYARGVETYAATGSSPHAESLFVKALALNGNDELARSLTSFYMTTLLNSLATEKNPEESGLSNQGYLTAAFEAAEQALAYDQTNYLNWLNIANLYAHIAPAGVEGANESAEKAFETALMYAPKHPSIYFARAGLAQSLDDTEKAEEDLKQALSIKPNYISALLSLADLYNTTNNISNAIKEATLAVQYAPFNVAAHYTLGALYYQNKSYNDAIRILEEALILSPQDPNIRYILALAYRDAGDKTKAQSLLDVLLEENPGNPMLLGSLDEITTPPIVVPTEEDMDITE